jgi:hypothetical protein
MEAGMSIPQDDRPHVDVICDAKSHHPVLLDRFVYDPVRGWRWDQTRNMGGGKIQPETGLREFYDSAKRNSAFEIDGHFKVSLDCPKCGLHLPIRWERWTPRLDALRHAGKTSVHLPALVAILTK